MQSFLMEQLHKQMFLQMLCEHIFAPMQVQQQGLGYQLTLTPFHYVYPPPIFLQHFLFVSVYHILQFCIFQDANVVIPLMIWVYICYIIRARVSTLQPMIHFKIPLQLSHQKVEFTYKKRFFTFSLPHTKMNGHYHHQRQFSYLGRCCHYQLDSYRFGETCFNDNNAWSDSCHPRQGTILHRVNAKK